MLASGHRALSHTSARLFKVPASVSKARESGKALCSPKGFTGGAGRWVHGDLAFPAYSPTSPESDLSSVVFTDIYA